MEKHVADAIALYLRSGTLTTHGYTPPSEHARATLEQTLIHAFVSASHIGQDIANAPRAERRGVFGGIKGILNGVFGGLMGKLTDLINDLLGNGGGDDGSLDDTLPDEDISDLPTQIIDIADLPTVELTAAVVDEVTQVLDGWIPWYATTVAETEIHAAVEEAVIDAMQSQGVAMISWDANPGACKACMDNAAASPLPIGAEWPSGDTAPPAHPNCRCTTSEYTAP